ncbi:hypothetical protein [Flavobacterium sp.]|uniref:hypothetical protein n=1 Tax=Flavobacterium sp. TaxID=239 RepID=UPI00375071AF
MKKANIIIGLLSVFLIILSSCSNENVDQTQVQLLKKIVEISVDGSSNTTLLSYDGNKIVNIDKVDKHSEFYYTDDLITKIVESDKTNQHINTLQYLYLNGQLSKITSSDNYVINYIHNSDGSVSYEKLTKDSNNNDVRINHGTLYFQSGNLIKDDKFLNDAGQGILAKNSISLEYDYKNNALNNILGFEKLLNYSKTISSNNDIAGNETSYVKHLAEDQVTSSIKTYNNKYTYNLNGYPTVIVSESLLLGGKNSNHLKSVLFYD